MDDAVAQIYRFCARLMHTGGVTPVPVFTFREHQDSTVSCTITLPASIDPSLRTNVSELQWRSSDLARQDAALTAYKRLYESGLLDHHLQPMKAAKLQSLPRRDISARKSSPSRAFVPWSPWISLPRDVGQSKAPDHDLVAPSSRTDDPRFLFTYLAELILHQTRTVPFWLCSLAPLHVQGLAARHGHYRLRIGEVQCLKVNQEDKLVVEASFQEFLRIAAPHLLSSDQRLGILCHPRKGDTSLSFNLDHGALPRYVSQTAEQVAKGFPLILWSCQLRLTAATFCQSFLQTPVSTSPLDLFVEALCPPGIGHVKNYEILEFRGDAILKFWSALNLMADYTKFPAGCLSASRETLISNERLSDAAIETGLASFIITQRCSRTYFRGLRGSSPPKAYSLPLKTAADVVEALIAVTYDFMDESHLLTLIRRLLSEVQWQSSLESVQILLHHHSSHTDTEDTTGLGPIANVEKLIKRSFRHKHLLLEALTHQSSMQRPLTPSFERLEFLGDSILDLIVTDVLRKSALGPARMHSLRESIVNRHFQAYCVFSTVLGYEVNKLEQKSEASSWLGRAISEPKFTTQVHNHILTNFIRCAPESNITEILIEDHSRYDSLHVKIEETLWNSTTYPWRHLTSMRPRKIISDVFEAVLAAVYVDSEGSMPDCVRLVEHFSFLKYLRHAIAKHIHVIHPKEEVCILAAGKQVDFAYEKMDDEQTRATISIDTHVLCCGVGGSKEEAQTTAADEAVRLLKRRVTYEDTRAATEEIARDSEVSSANSVTDGDDVASSG